jgi:hypothetical protein
MLSDLTWGSEQHRSKYDTFEQNELMLKELTSGKNDLIIIKKIN